MSLKDQLMADMKEAMKARAEGKERLSVIRMVRSAIKNIEINEKKDLSDDEVIEVIAREVKQRRDAIPDYENGNRLDIVEGLKHEIDILMGYLPRQLSEEEIRSIVSEVIAEVGATSPKDMGKVMGKLMPKVKGKADGKVVSKVVKELLAD